MCEVRIAGKETKRLEAQDTEDVCRMLPFFIMALNILSDYEIFKTFTEYIGDCLLPRNVPFLFHRKI